MTCVSDQVSYYFLRIFMIYFHCTSYPLPHPLKYVLLWEMNWNKVSHYSLMIFDKNTNLLFLKVFYKTTNPLFLRIFSENVPLNVSTVSPLPSPPLPHFSRCCFWIRFHFTLKVAKTSWRISLLISQNNIW